MKIVSLKEKYIWLDYFNKLPRTSKDIYYTPEYYQLYEENGDGEALCFIFEENEELALYPFLKNQVPYGINGFDIQGAYGYNGVVASTDNAQFIANFHDSFRSYCKEENIVAEFTRFNPVLKNHLFSKDDLSVRLDREIVAIDINKEWSIIRQNFSSSVKRNINKALKNGLEVVFLDKVDSTVFKELYHETMIRVGSGEYLFFNQHYFDEIFKMKTLRQVIVMYNNEVIASSICFILGDYFHYHLGASKTEYLHLRPNDLLFEGMIALAHQKNCKYIQLGGGTSSASDDTLLRYKSKFSKEKLSFYIGKKIHNLDLYNQLIDTWKNENNITEQNDYNNLLRYQDTLMRDI